MKNDTRVNATRMPIASVQLSGAVKADQGCRSIPFLTVLRLRGIRHSGQWISIRAPALDLEAAAGMDSVLRRARVRVPPPSPGGRGEAEGESESGREEGEGCQRLYSRAEGQMRPQRASYCMRMPAGGPCAEGYVENGVAR